MASGPSHRVRLTRCVAIAWMLVWVSAATAQAVEVIVDNGDPGFAVLSGVWITGTAATPYGSDYRWRSTTSGPAAGEVEWRPSLPEAGSYDVAVWYVSGVNRATNAAYVIDHADGTATVAVNQQINGSQWFSIGSFDFNAGTSGRVRLNDVATGSVVIADAVRFTRVAPDMLLTMTVQPVHAGTTHPTAGQVHSYASGSVVNMAAMPVVGYQFSHWSASGGSSPANPTAINTSIAMDQSKTVAAVFVPACSDALLTGFESYGVGTQVMFRNPRFSVSTSTHLVASPDVSEVADDPSALDGAYALKLSWQFTDATAARWVRVTTFDAANLPNPVIALDKPVRVRLRLESGTLRVSLGVRETGTASAIGSDGGTSGAIEWIGPATAISGAPQGKLLTALPGVWQSIVFDPGRDPVLGFTGNGVLSAANNKGVLEHLAFAAVDSAGPFTVYVDEIEQLCQLPPVVLGDFDFDRDVDRNDLSYFLACVTGAGLGPPSAVCAVADLDHNSAVDLADFGAMQACISGSDVLPDPACTPAQPAIPPRPADAITGSAFVSQVWSLPKAAREQLILGEMSAGNIPEFLRSFVPVTVSADDHTGTFYVMPDVLAIGSDADYVRFPMGPLTAQSIGDAFQCTLPTRKMVNDIYAAATVKLAPHPYSPSVYDIQSVDVFNQSNTYIEGQRTAAGAPVGSFLGGIKKDVVITKLLATTPGKVAIYGWHQLNGQPIQPLYLGHEITYMDYSHGIRMVKLTMLVDGVPMLIPDVLKDPVLSALLSDEGVVNDPRYH